MPRASPEPGRRGGRRPGKACPERPDEIGAVEGVPPGRRGGRRPNAGAPKGNLNALKHGGYSRQFARLGAVVAASPAMREQLFRLAARHQARGRKADELATYILSQVIARGLKRGRDRLILLPPVDDAASIIQNHEIHEGKTEFDPHNNQSPRDAPPGQSETR